MGEPSMQLTGTFLIVLSLFILNDDVASGQGPSAAIQVLEDFIKAEPDGFPVGWQASRSVTTISSTASFGRMEASTGFTGRGALWWTRMEMQPV